MSYLSVIIRGIPYSKDKTRGDLRGPERWDEAIISQTKDLPLVSEACILKATFLLPPDKYPADLPYGPDLDNLLKRLLDALNKTIFKAAHGGDSCIVSINAMKTRVPEPSQAGVHLEVLPVRLGPTSTPRAT